MTSEVERYVAPLEGPVVTVCGLVEASCHCVLPPHSDGIHKCDCGGSWEYVDGEMIPHSLPGLSRIFAGMGLGFSFGRDDENDEDEDGDVFRRYGLPSVLGGLFTPRPWTAVGAPVQIGFAGPRECHTTDKGIRVHVQPGCRCPRRRS